MTTHDDNDRQEFREYARALFANVECPPRDVVPPTGLTREALERQSAAYLKPCISTIPGEVICDTDGYPIGVTESRSVSAIFAGTAISKVDADRLGIAAGELPGIHIIETRNTEEN